MPVATLTYEEQREFKRLDEAVVMGVKAAKVVMKAGTALARIREGQLFRDTFPTWEKYLDGHGLTRRRADQLIQAARIIEGVDEVLTGPGGERRRPGRPHGVGDPLPRRHEQGGGRGSGGGGGILA